MKNLIFIGLSLFIAVNTSHVFAFNYCTDITKNLSKGAQNSQVLALQQYLFEARYLSVKPNGYFGAGTVKAVKNFQTFNNLPATGSVSIATRSKIKEISCGKDVVSVSAEDKKLLSTFSTSYWELANNSGGYYINLLKYEEFKSPEKERFNVLVPILFSLAEQNNQYSSDEIKKMSNEALTLVTLFIKNLDNGNVKYDKATKALNELKITSASFQNERVKVSTNALITVGEKTLKAEHELASVYREKENLSRSFLQAVKDGDGSSASIARAVNIMSDEKMNPITTKLNSLEKETTQLQNDFFKAQGDYQEMLGLQ